MRAGGVAACLLAAAAAGAASAAPGFVDASAQNFHLLDASVAVDAGATALHPDVLPVHEPVSQYREHQALDARPEDGAPDLGGFELPEPGAGAGLAAGVLALCALVPVRSRALACDDR